MALSVILIGYLWNLVGLTAVSRLMTLVQVILMTFTGMLVFSVIATFMGLGNLINPIRLLD